MNLASVPSEVRETLLEQWLTKYGNAVLRTCFIYLCDRALAEDAAQDTFIKVWKNMGKYEGRNGSSAKTWIMRIAINTCKDYKRSAWFQHVDLSKALEDIPSAFRAVTDESRSVYIGVMRLPIKLKQAVLLYYFHSMTLAEVAETLHISRSAVQQRLKKAYSLLRFHPEGSDFDGK